MPLHLPLPATASHHSQATQPLQKPSALLSLLLGPLTLNLNQPLQKPSALLSLLLGPVTVSQPLQKPSTLLSLLMGPAALTLTLMIPEDDNCLHRQRGARHDVGLSRCLSGMVTTRLTQAQR